MQRIKHGSIDMELVSILQSVVTACAVVIVLGLAIEGAQPR